MVNGMSKDIKVISSKDMINEITNILNPGDDKLHNLWKSILTKIKRFNDTEDISFGEKLAMNSKVIELKNGILLIETNHSGWIQYFRIYEKFILNGLNRAIPELKIRTLAFRIRGSEISLSESYEESKQKEMEEYEKIMDKNEKKLFELKKTNNSEGSSNLPKDLFDKLESLKKRVDQD